jgi:site-specific DNA-cytosine methylase
MNVLSLFDGISCGQLALQRSGVEYKEYCASEIKQYAIDLVKRRFPDTWILGDVRDIHYVSGRFEIKNGDSWLESPEVELDLILAGSPCKGLSFMNQNQEGLDHDESKLFWEFVRLYGQVKKHNPNVKFLLENVPGNKEAVAIITKTMGVRPIRMNSSMVTAQNRIRLYWTNIKVDSLPKKKYLTTMDVFEDNMPEDLLITNGRINWLTSESGKKSVEKGYTKINPFPKAGCITANGHKKWNENYIFRDGKYRYLSIRELERLQTLPEGYCDGLTYDEAYDVIGDGWTVDIVAHILNHMNQ